MATFDGRSQRLLNEKRAIEDLCKNSNTISFAVHKPMIGTDIPEIYDITFKLRTFIGINKDNTPIFGNKHIIRIDLSNNYPTFPAAITALTDIWHPNIKYFEPGKGHVCSNQDGIGNETMFNLLLRLKDILLYRNYWAENAPPYPDDLEVASWVREYGEPKGFIEALLAANADGAVKVNEDGKIDIEELVIDFMDEVLNICADPVIVEEDDVDPNRLMKMFTERYKDLSILKDATSLKELILAYTIELKNDGKIILLF